MATKTLLTGDDLYRIVSDGSRYELLEGELFPMTPVGMEHGGIVGTILELLRRHVRAGNVGLVGAEIGFRLTRNPDTVRAPDVAFVARERLPKEGVPKKFADFAPDLAVEVLSPEDTASEILRKVEEYLAAGTRLVWVVDPATRTVTVYRSLHDVKVLTESEELDGGDVLPGFKTTVAELFKI
jgi:Uma2 family endonuclease